MIGRLLTFSKGHSQQFLSTQFPQFQDITAKKGRGRSRIALGNFRGDKQDYIFAWQKCHQ